MIALETRDIGGGVVRRLFTTADRTYRAGDKLTADEVLSWPAANRRALIASRFIDVYPVNSEVPFVREPERVARRKAKPNV